MRQPFLASCSPLVKWNRLHWGDPRLRWCLPLMFLLAMGVYCLPPILRGQWTQPPKWGDGPDYENIALQLYRGNGFSRCSDAEFFEPYAAVNADGRYDYLLGPSTAHCGSGLTAYRPPLLPVVMAGTYHVFGRKFWPIRLIHAAVMATTVLLTSILIYRFAGPLPAILGAGIFLLADPCAIVMGTAIRTESWACLALALIAFAAVRFAESGTLKAAACLGAAVGLAILARTSFVPWLPLLGVGVLFWGRGTSHRQAYAHRLAAVAVFLAVALLVLEEITLSARR